ncbi:Uma2 family endonuclease [Salicibibacter kimchii]|uniref:Uma2 family endonuclease n=1 Tax=Salicibibacter kimchii TaxID=2099786 RepID=A0A345C2R6_9BACI|nr:Uma2 family endonuclease [Salicibibacter kimchii]AXF57497.1 Uma2 family endonuclease [Salicibibacter kimchii]
MSKKEDKHPSVREQVLTYNDYAALDDGNRYELVNGQLELMRPVPSTRHQLISYELNKKISASCENEYFILYAPIDLILSNSEVRQPDIVMVHRDRLNILSRKGIEGPPDLVVEILSPSTLKRDKMDKLQAYARFCIPEYWIVEPELGILEQHVLKKDTYELANIYHQDEPITSRILPCISFTMDKVMENIPNI